jgi:uncharacterized protein (TIGR03118 family)
MMTTGFRPRSRRGLSLLTMLAALLIMAVPSLARAENEDNGRFVTQTNLVSDLSGTAHMQDGNLVNPWGLAASPTGPWWVADNGKGVSTAYDANGNPQLKQPVTIPPPGGSPPGTTAAPTGLVFNSTGDFAVTDGSKTSASVFLFATEDGTLSGWSPKVNQTNAILAVDNSGTGAVYKGLALARNRSGNFLFATNFHAGTVDVFDAHFKPAHLAGTFTDPTLPNGFAPFGIRAFGDRLYVTYALQKPDKHDDQAGPGNGFVDIYDTNGRLLRHLIAHGALNSPWGLAMAPDEFGRFGEALLVGNFGDGHINAYNPENGKLLGPLMGSDGKPIVIDGVWALSFGNGGQAGRRDTLFFTAGIDDEQHGLFGTLVSREREQ